MIQSIKSLIIHALTMMLIVAPVTSTVASDDTLLEVSSLEMNSCVSLQNDSARLKCFDQLAVTLIKSDSNQLPVSETKTLPEDIGGGKFSDGTEEEKGVRGHITSCQKSVDGKWFYIFESGQVWKQTDRAKRRYRECDFYVTITEDGFGYMMRVDDETRTTRIRRHR